MHVHHYQAIIFDFDDTLVKSGPIKWAHHKAVAKEFYDLELTDATLKTHWGKPFDQMIGHLYQQADTVENMRAANYSLEHRYPKTLIPDAHTTLDRLHQAGLKLAVLSAMNRDIVFNELVRFDFPVNDFLFIQGAEDTPAHKPDPAVFAPALSALAKLKISPEHTLYVGDALSDFYAATGAGLHFLGVTTGFVTQAEFDAAGAKSAPNLTKLVELIFDSPDPK
jgi:HAD superfamily hydrolase (TIGR01549 family)